VTYTANKVSYRDQINIHGTGGHTRKPCKMLVRKSKGMREIERARHKEKNNVKMYIR
jgi:hypothetical protein